MTDIAARAAQMQAQAEADEAAAARVFAKRFTRLPKADQDDIRELCRRGMVESVSVVLFKQRGKP